MIIHGLWTVIVIATIAAGAVITGPTTTRLPSQDSNFIDASHGTPIDKMTTVQPTQFPLITCFCNMPECLTPVGGEGVCSTRLGCFSEVRTVLPEMEAPDAKPQGFTASEPVTSVNGSEFLPNIPNFDAETTTPRVMTPSSERGSYGCLDSLHYSKKPCDEILKSMESDASEFPVIQVPTNSAQSTSNNALVFAFHCCQTPGCNGNQSAPAEDKIKSAQAVLIAALKTYLALEPSTEIKQNATSPKKMADKLAAIKYGLTSIQFNKEKMVMEGPAMIALGEPKPPSALKSETSENAEIGSTTSAALAASTAPAAIVAPAEPAAIVAPAEPAAIVAPAEPAAMQPILSDAELVQQELPQNATVGNLEHVVVKRHDNQRGT